MSLERGVRSGVTRFFPSGFFDDNRFNRAADFGERAHERIKRLRDSGLTDAGDVDEYSRRALFDLRFFAVDDRRHRQDLVFRIDKHGVTLEVGEEFGVGCAFGVRFEDLPAAHFLAGHAERDEWIFVGIHRAVVDVAADGRQVVHADRGELAVAADAPVQIFLQLHDGDEAGFVDGRQRHHGARDERAVARFVGERFVDLHREARWLRVVFRQSGFDSECAAEGAGEATDVEQVGAIGEEVEPHYLLAAGPLEGRFGFKAAHGAGFDFVLAERVLDE